MLYAPRPSAQLFPNNANFLIPSASEAPNNDRCPFPHRQSLMSTVTFYSSSPCSWPAKPLRRRWSSDAGMDGRSIVQPMVTAWTAEKRRLALRQLSGRRTPKQWSFRKTGTMGTLASQAEIGVWVQAPGAFLWKSEIVYAKSCNIVHYEPENFSQCRP